MLDAFIRKRVRRILERSGDEHENDKTEDAITSMIFTPLQFMSAGDALSCFSAFLSDELSYRPEDVTVSKIELWPELQEGGTRCEPDLVAQFQFTDGQSLVLVGEMKWESPFKAEQIARQRIAARIAYKHSCLKTFAITKHRVNGGSLECDLGILTWTLVHRHVSAYLKRPNSRPVVKRWAQLVGSFLENAEQLIFEGVWADEKVADLFDGIPSVDSQSIFFERTMSFKGFGLDYEGLPEASSRSIFYEAEKCT